MKDSKQTAEGSRQEPLAIFGAAYYRDAGRFTTQEEGLYELQAIRVEPHPKGGAVIIATNGHTMGIFHDAYAACAEPITIYWKKWLSDLCGTAFAIVIAHDKSLRVAWAEKHFGRSNGKVTSGPVAYRLLEKPPIVECLGMVPGDNEARFPNWQMVLPTAREQSLAYNANYLASFALNSNPEHAIINLFYDDANSQQVVACDGRDDFVGIIMPCVSNEEYPAEFLEPFIAPEVKARADAKAAAAAQLTTQNSELETACAR